MPNTIGMNPVDIEPVGKLLLATVLGFLGAGMILKNTQGQVHGLTTAAGIWAVGAVGVAIGTSLYLTAS